MPGLTSIIIIPSKLTAFLGIFSGGNAAALACAPFGNLEEILLGIMLSHEKIKL